MASEEEERIRAKTVAMLRRRFPDARIIHELKLDDSIRIDLAAVTPDLIAVAEIKSEKDNLKRAGPQIKKSLLIAGQVFLIVNEKLAPAVEALSNWRRYQENPSWLREEFHRACEKHKAKFDQTITQECHNALFASPVQHMIEKVDRDDFSFGRHVYSHENSWGKIQPSALLGMMWAAELRSIGARNNVACLGNMGSNMVKLIEHLSGRQIRQEVCRELRSRPFARADDPVIEGRCAVPRQEPLPL